MVLGISFIPSYNFANPASNNSLPEVEIDSATGKPKIFNYKQDLKGFTHPGLDLQNFTKKNLVIFYFSALCPHCQNAAPLVSSTAQTLKGQNVSLIAIAVAQNTDSEISQYISNGKFTAPLFQDQKNFGRQYGNGRVPLTLVVHANGQYRRLPGFEPHTPALIKKAFNLK